MQVDKQRILKKGIPAFDDKTNDDIHVNKKYKDTVFRKLFGENRENALSLYNAVNGTAYTNPDDLEYTTLEDVIYMKYKNDVLFLIDKTLSLYEHQSSYNPNMPLRGFLYYADLYRKLIHRSERLYSKHLLKIPRPHYIVFYNGSEKELAEERRILRLSDAFETDTGAGEYEWTATMININSGKNQSIMDSCHVLYEYAVFVAKIKKYRDSMELKEAIDLTVRECIEENILRDFLEQHRREVCDMCLTEFDEKKYEDVLREEGREEGLAEGRSEERKTLLEIVQKLKEGKTPEQLVADGMEKESVDSAIMLRKLL